MRPCPFCTCPSRPTTHLQQHPPLSPLSPQSPQIRSPSCTAPAVSWVLLPLHCWLSNLVNLVSSHQNCISLCAPTPTPAHNQCHNWAPKASKQATDHISHHLDPPAGIINPNSAKQLPASVVTDRVAAHLQQPPETLCCEPPALHYQTKIPWHFTSPPALAMID